ncbi:hypothetical protein [Oceanobacillus kapialis]|uniref:DUF3995 domain-containing protein n=1 Tax=Oceanobacillus kapialis TaxID=481353 RepID=A0ABW5Q4G1_9BACI
MRVILELIRILLIFLLLGGLLGAVLNQIYRINGEIQSYQWIGNIGILLVLFVLYRNKFQFSGWYQGKGRHKLPRKVTFVLLSASLLCIFLPFALGIVIR